MPPSLASVLRQAEGYLELELPAQAVAVLEQAPVAQRTGFAWSYAMGEAQRELKQYVVAAGHFEAARHADPEHVGVYVGLGWCYKRTDQLPRAIETLLAAEQYARRQNKKSEHALLMYNLACYCSLAGRKPEMLHWLKAALEKDRRYLPQIPQETDFDPSRDDSEFQQLLLEFKDAPPADEGDDDEPMLA